ncbi:MAG TPA: DUF2339 domain-containing protein [Chitinophagaceae bacterium]|nr:DUF2339 domain-containing protein [Chitinophagaceae bacterium]
MGALIVLAILIPVVFFILLIVLLNNSSEQKRLLEALYDKISHLDKQLDGLTSVKKPVAAETPVKIESIVPVTVKEKIPEPEIQPLSLERKDSMDIPGEEHHEPIPGQPGWWDRWVQKNHDLEKFIGENLANKIGIAVLVLGIAFFVKYAIDKNWIRENGRVLIGFISGIILLGLGHYTRNRYRSFSSVLAGGGIAVFYFTTAFAFQQYHLFGQQVAFGIMILITILAVILSLVYNRIELAVLATLGGFITPFLLNNGNENLVALFTYIGILNAGLMVLAWFKRWSPLTTIALFFTLIIYGGWLGGRLLFNDGLDIPLRQALVFGSVFYLELMVISILNAIRLKSKFSSFDFIMVLSINSLYYGAGIAILGLWHQPGFKGYFTIALAVFNFLLFLLFRKKKSTDRNFVFLLLGLSISLVTLAIPVQFNGNQVTLFWAAETVLLYALYQRSGVRLLKDFALILALLMLISLVNTWSAVYFPGAGTLPVLLNKGFITGMVAATALILFRIMLRKNANTYYINTVTVKMISNALLVLAVCCYYCTGVLEVYYQFSNRFPLIDLFELYLQLYTYLFVFMLLYIFRKRHSRFLLRIGLTGICIGLYIFTLPSDELLLSIRLQEAGLYKRHFIVHWAGALVLFKLLSDLFGMLLKNKMPGLTNRVLLTWLTSILLVFFISREMYGYFSLNYFGGNEWDYWENLFYKAGLTIVWSLSSFIMMWLGMKYHYRALRIISLTLFSITLVKLFVVDIRNIPPGGKISAFILLGILLLTVSFMYQRLKKIIIDDGTEKN